MVNVMSGKVKWDHWMALTCVLCHMGQLTCHMTLSIRDDMVSVHLVNRTVSYAQSAITSSKVVPISSTWEAGFSANQIELSAL